MIKNRKLMAMHEVYGKDTEGRRCRGCCNLTESCYNGRNHVKCKAYGVGGSSTTDWNANFLACKLRNVPAENFEPLIRQIRRQSGYKEAEND